MIGAIVRRARLVWDRYWSSFRGHRQAVGGLWFETQRGHWVQGLERKILTTGTTADFPGYIGVRITGELEVTSMPFDHGMIVLVREDEPRQRELATAAFENLLARYLEHQRRRGAERGLPIAKQVR